MSEEKFSIVVPTLNEEEHIKNLIISVHSRISKPIELLVIDDGSSDDTIKIVRSLNTR